MSMGFMPEINLPGMLCYAMLKQTCRYWCKNFCMHIINSVMLKNTKALNIYILDTTSVGRIYYFLSVQL